MAGVSLVPLLRRRRLAFLGSPLLLSHRRHLWIDPGEANVGQNRLDEILIVNAMRVVLKKKANIIVSMSDVLGTNHVSFKLNQGSVSASGSRVNDTRRLGITIRYNFGMNKQKENKEFGAPVDN